MSSLKKTHEWRFSQEPFLAQQTWAQDQHVSAELLLHLGETRRALELTELITERPDRQGGDSIQSDQKEAGTLMLYRSVAQAEAARLEESQTWQSGLAWWKAILERQKLLNEIHVAAIKVRSLASNNDRFSASLRPYYAPGTFIMTDWHRPDLVSVYGAGVAAEALSEVYEDPSENFELEKPALEVVRAEIAWSRGDEDDAIEILKATIPELGEAKGVLRARAQARLVGLLFDEGRFDEAMEYGVLVLDTAPAMFRHLDISLPVRLESDGSDKANQIVKKIRKSPRFHANDRGFPIKVRSSSGNLIATFSSPHNSLLAEVSVPAVKRKVKKQVEKQTSDNDAEVEPEAEEELDPVEDLVALFHKKAFAPRLDLSQSDVNSLDGSTLTDSRRNSKARDTIGLPSLRPADRTSL